MTYAAQRVTDGPDRLRASKIDARLATIEDDIDSGVIGGGGGGGGPATSLDTTGAAVNVGSAAPPTTGQVLQATSATTATWQTLDATDVSALAASTTLDAVPAPVASVDFDQQQATQFRIENRTSDPGTPAVGEIWLRTDL
jgi:hypothetical protein